MKRLIIAALGILWLCLPHVAFAQAPATASVSFTTTITVEGVRFNVDGCDYLVALVYLKEAKHIDRREICIKADRSATDRTANFEPVGTVAVALMSDLNSVRTRLDAVVAAARAAGKLQPEIAR